jgi:hypothetical protein
MKNLLLVLPIIFIPLFVNAQSKKAYIEINPYIQLDWYPEFSHTYGSDQLVDQIKLSGASRGILFNYKLPVTESIYLKPGIGYHKVAFDQISRAREGRAATSGRKINYQSGKVSFDIPYYTDQYHYKTVNINLAIDKHFDLKNNWQIISSLYTHHFFSLSQHYRLTHNPGGSRDYKKTKSGYFGSSLGVTGALTKRFNRLAIGPSIRLPVYSRWKTDDTFPDETKSDSRGKWFNGVGLGITVNYLLNHHLPSR